VALADSDKQVTPRGGRARPTEATGGRSSTTPDGRRAASFFTPYRTLSRLRARAGPGLRVRLATWLKARPLPLGLAAR
jgi:hypothetical protein